MKMALASVISAAPPDAVPNRIRNTSAVLRKLSLKAEKNWQANSGKNLREKISIPLYSENAKGGQRGRPPSPNSPINLRHERTFRDEGSIQIAAHVTAMAMNAVIAKSVVHMTDLSSLFSGG